MLAIFRLEQKATALRELATMLKAGMSLGESLHVVATRRSYPGLRQALSAAARRISGGERLSEVLPDYPQEFSKLTIAVIAAGEQTGNLDGAFDQVAGYLEREYKLRQMISRETFYPKVLAAMCIIMPIATQAIITAILVSIWAGLLVFAGGLLKWALILAIPAALIYMVYRAIANTEEGRKGIDSFKLRVPVIGPVVRRLALARFGRALAYAYQAGVPLSEAIALSAAVSGNAVIQRRLSDAIPLVRKGHKLSEVLATAPEIDDMALRMLQTGEQTGQLSETMERVAEHFEIAAETSIRRMAVMAVPIGVIIMGIIIGYMVINFYAGYFSGLM